MRAKGRRKKASPRKTSRAEAPDPKRSPVDAARLSRFQVDDGEVERLLQTGEHQGLLESYFGEAEYAELADLARQTSTRSLRGGPRVLIVPGLMGSKLGAPRKLLSFFTDTLWIDPVEIALGRLLELALPGNPEIEPIGVILLAYLKLKLRLRVAGFDADFAPYDWRHDLDTLGQRLWNEIRKDPADTVHLVAHSMGGLVARAALASEGQPREASKIGRLVMLGTPNHGSFVPAQAIRGTLSTVSLLAGLDLANSAETLSRRVFTTLPGLVQLLPDPERWSELDLYRRASWPSGPKPSTALLRDARGTQAALAPADDRFVLIAGVNRRTTVGMRRDGDEFVYETSRAGDGTVPLALAELEGAKTYYTDAAHGRLPNNRGVGRAVIDLLSSGKTRRLADTYAPRRAEPRRELREAELRETPYPVDPALPLGPREGRALLDLFVSPESDDGVTGDGTAEESAALDDTLGAVVVSRRRQQALEIRLARGSITEVDTRALVLGLFREVAPAGAARAVDEILDGAVKEFTDRRMFSGHVGEVFVLPTGRSRVFAESVLFAGLGRFDSFDAEVQEFVAENVVRTFVRTHVEDFATVLMGAGSGQGVRHALTHQLRGFVRGLRDRDRDQRLRRITLCEWNAERFDEIKRELLRLSSTALFEEVNLTIDEVVLPEPAPPPSRGHRLAVEYPRLAYLVVAQTEYGDPKPWSTRDPAPERRTHVELRASLLTSTDRRQAKAAVLTGTRRVSLDTIDALQRRSEDELSERSLAQWGRKFGEELFTDDVLSGLHAMRENHLVVIHDEGQPARLPWEVLRVRGWAPAAAQGLSRRYAADKLSVAKWLEERRSGDELDLLLVVNPTGDLDGAVDEAERIRALFGGASAVRVHTLEEREATRRALLAEFSSGRYDVLHYAGHAYFDPDTPSRSGILCHGGEVLSGAHLAHLSNLPALVFFNACESGRTRGRRAPRGDDKKRRAGMPKRIERNVGLAEAFLRGGVANYLGTYWPVGDAAASAFAKTFYTELVEGAPIGSALQAGRNAVRDTGSIDWADYIHYGSWDFTLKRLGQGPRRDPASR